MKKYRDMWSYIIQIFCSKLINNGGVFKLLFTFLSISKEKPKRKGRIVSFCSFRIVFQADRLTGAQLLKGAYMYTLGINAAYHDPAACLIRDGQVIAAAEEERFTHIKHGKRPIPFSTYELPFHAIDYFLREADINFID